jgi:PAS domain S-box-containing protein
MNFIKHASVRYGLAVLASLLAVFLRWLLEPLIGTNAAFITVFPAFMVVAVTLGAGPGLVGAALGVVLIEWFFLGPIGIELDFAVLARATILLSTSAYVGLVGTRLRAALAKADAETAAARASSSALQQQVELIDPARAQIIAQEMQRIVRDREATAVSAAGTTGEGLRRVPALVGAGIAALGVIVLLGWVLDVDGLKSVLPGLPTMKANTALCFLLIGLALLVLKRAEKGMPEREAAMPPEREAVPLRGAAFTPPEREAVPLRGAAFTPPEREAVPLHGASGAARLPEPGSAASLPERLSLLCTGLVCVVAGLTVAEYATGLDFGLDQLLFRDVLDEHTLYSGRMTPVTASCFVLVSASLLLLAVPRGRWLQQALALATGLVGLTGVLGYLYDVKQLYQFAGVASMALHTAAGFVVLSVGLLFARTDGLVRVLSGAAPGSQLARRFLPVVILLPILLGWLHEAGERSGVWGAPVGAGLLVLMMLFSLLVVVWWIAQILNCADAARRETEAQLRHQSELMDHADEALIVREEGGVIRFWNKGAAALYGWSAAEALGQRTHVLLRTEGVRLEEKDEQLLRTGHWEGELTHTTRDGRRVFVESRQTATHADDGHLLILESDRDITARRQAEATVLQLNDQLEQRVRERTAELESANRELEAFCYSVSHDLRTPLRTIDGFSQATLEDYGERLDDTGRDYLNRVRNGCRNMDQLIDDLLRLSRVTRDQMRRESVDLTALAHAAVRLLHERDPERSVDIRIAPGLSAVGDTQLLHAALFNLLANAWKFTSKNPAPVIEVGSGDGGQGSSFAKATADRSGFRVQETGENAQCARPHDTPVFFVRDNGVGFDMQYANKLFNAFQRLHSVQEFPGTGIGLATVARIIHRHGGRIWVEAAIERGATFYFTLETGLENSQ